MKFLVDAQLPSKLCEILTAIGIDSIHVDSLPEKDETPDREITMYADANGLVVLSKDLDFYHSHMVLGQPKKLLLITTGNIKNRRLFDLIRKNGRVIENLLKTCNFVEMSNDGIIAHSC